MSETHHVQNHSSHDVAWGLVQSLRPQQWYKQGILFVALLFSLNAGALSAWIDITIGALLWCLVAGGVYLFNDVHDREEDRAHPRKRHRPIASGLVGRDLALGTSALLVGGSLGTSWVFSPVFAAILAAYVGQNLLYSTILRDLLFVDLLVIGVGFVLRALGGVAILGAPVSPWLVLCTFLTAVLLGLGKRTAEIQALGDRADTRATLDGYDEDLIEMLFTAVVATLLVSYSLYTFFSGSNWMMITIPFALYAVARYTWLVTAEGLRATEDLFRDEGMVVNLGFWIAAIIGVLYGAPVLEGWLL